MSTNTNNPQLDISRLKYENENIKIVLNQVISEYADYRIECDEICKEYEETIQLLSDSLEQYKSQISKLNTEKEKMKNDQEKVKKELEKSREKNKEKIKDIEILNNKLDELNSKFKSIDKKETTLKSKVVTLETDNDHYLNKIHQYEEEVADLKEKLENSIENLIMTQNDFEKYKNRKEEELQRLKLNLQEEKGTITALMNQKGFNKHARLKSSINLKKNVDNEELKETKIEAEKRKLSWNEEKKIVKGGKKDNGNQLNRLNTDVFDIDQQFDLIIEKGLGRNNRSMTIQKTNYDIGDIFSRMRKRREELVKFNQKIKRDHAKFISN